MNNGCRRSRSAAEDAEGQAEDEHDGGEADQDPSVYRIRLRDEKTLRTPGPRHALANLLIVGVPWSSPEKPNARGGDPPARPNPGRHARPPPAGASAPPRPSGAPASPSRPPPDPTRA